MIDPDLLTDGSVICVKGRRGRYTCRGLSTTKAGRTVVTLVGPIGTGYQAFHACYLEDVRSLG